MNRDVLRNFFQHAMGVSRALLLVALGCVATQAAAQISVTPSFAFGGPVANTSNTTVRLTFNHTQLMTSVNGITSSVPVSLTNATFVSPTPTTNTCPASVVGVSATQISLSPLATPVLSELNTSCVMIWNVTINGPVSGNATISVAANSLSATVSSIFGPPTNFVFPSTIATASTFIGSAPATMTVSVAPSTIRPDESVIATYTLTSSQINGDFIASGDIFMPTGVTIDSTPPPTNTCGTFGNIGSIPDVFSFGMGTVPNTGCTITLSLSASAAGVYTLTVSPGDLSAGGPNTNTSSVNFSAQSPIITPQTPLGNTVLAGSVFPLNYQIANPGGASSVVSGTINLVPGFTYGTPTTTCAGLVPVRTGNQITFSGSLTAGEICQVGVSVTATVAPGLYSFTIAPGNLLIEGSSNTNNSNAPVTVVATVPPTVSVSLGTPTVLVSADTTVTYTFSNPNAQPLPIFFGSFDAPFGVDIVGVPTNTCGGASSVVFGSIVQIRIDNGAIPANGTCTLTATVNSATAGIYNFNVGVGNLSAVVGNSNSTTAALNVVAAAANFTLTEGGVNIGSGLTFASQPVGTSSASRTIVLTNTGNANLSISGIAGVAPFADFSFTTTCPILTPPVAPGGTCNIVVTFSPALSGGRNATIAINSNSVGGSPINISLAGTGTQPGVSLTPAAALTFAAQAIGTTSAVQTVTLTNTGSTGLLISAITTTGDFAATNNCPVAPSALPVGTPPLNQCTISVTFTPTSATPPARTGALVINTTNAPPNTYSIGLNGTASLSPTVAVSLAPPTVLVNSNSVITYTLSNPNGSPLAITLGRFTVPPGASVSGAPANTCGGTSSVLVSASTEIRVAGGSIPANGTCNITANVSAAAVGTYNFVINAGDLDAGVSNTNTTNAFLNVIATAANFTLTEGGAGIGTGLLFASQPVGTSSASRTVVVTSSGTANLVLNSITGVAPFTDFTFTTNCPIGTPPLAPGGTCNIVVTFSPIAPGNRGATISIDSNANIAGAPVNFSLAGNGTQADVALNPGPSTPLNFPSQIIGTTSAAQTVTLSNTGNAPLLIASISTTGDFASASNCPISPATLANGTPPLSQCTINVTFTPTSLQPAARTGFLLIGTTNAPTNSYSVGLNGTASAVPVPAVSVTPTSLTFPATTVGNASAAQRLTVTNTGTANLTGITIATTAGYQRVAVPPSANGPFDCGATLAPSTSCVIAIQFVPTVAGSFAGQVTITSPSVTPNTTIIPVSGVGAPAPVPVIALPGIVNFGDQIIGTASTGQTVSISNTGTATMTVSSITVAGTDAASFTTTGGCGAITPGTSCNVTVTFQPATLGTKNAVLSVVSNAQNAATTNAVALTGVGVPVPRPIATLSLTSVSFGNTIFGGAAATQTLSLQNTGVLPLAISGVIASPDYVQLNNCPANLAPQASCTVQVQFVPTGLGPRVGDLTVISNAPTSPDRVALRGVGCRWFSATNARLFTTLCGN
jgi:hypothetical protein